MPTPEQPNAPISPPASQTGKSEPANPGVLRKGVLFAYMLVVHLALATLAVLLVKSNDTGHGLRTEWLDASTLTEEQIAFIPDVVDTETFMLRFGDETIGMLRFEKGQLEGITIRWPGDPKEIAIADSWMSVDTNGYVLRRSKDEFNTMFLDRDGDGAPDLRSREEADEYSRAYAEWRTVWRRNRYADGTFGPLEIFNPEGELTIRVTEHHTEMTPPTFGRSSYTIERFENGQPTSTETVDYEDYDRSALIKEANPDTD